MILKGINIRKGALVTVEGWARLVRTLSISYCLVLWFLLSLISLFFCFIVVSISSFFFSFISFFPCSRNFDGKEGEKGMRVDIGCNTAGKHCNLMKWQKYWSKGKRLRREKGIRVAMWCNASGKHCNLMSSSVPLALIRMMYDSGPKIRIRNLAPDKG